MIVAKFITSLRNDAVITQETVQSEVIIKKELLSFGIASFSMPIISGLQEDTVVELYEVGNTDVLVFRGYVHEISPVRGQFDQVDIVLRSEKAIMQRRKVLGTKSYSSQTISTILADLLDDYSTYGENRSVSTTISDTKSLNLSVGDSYYDIIDEIAEEAGAFRDIQDGVLYMKTRLGEDKTSGTNFQEVIYDYSNPNNSNIKTIEAKGIAKRANIVIGKDQSGTVQTDTSGFSDVLYGVIFETYRDGDLTSKITKTLEKENRNQRVYAVSVDQNAIDAEVGDEIKLEVVNTNVFFDFSGTVTVSKKTITYTNGTKFIDYELQDVVVYPVTLSSYMGQLKKKIRLLQV